MSLIDTISQIKNKDGKNGVFKHENPQVSSRFINMGKLLSRNGINNKLFENNSKPPKNTYNTDINADINADKISNIVSTDKKYMVNDISVGDTNKINHINPIKNIVSSNDDKNISNGSLTPDYKSNNTSNNNTSNTSNNNNTSNTSNNNNTSNTSNNNNTSNTSNNNNTSNTSNNNNNTSNVVNSQSNLVKNIVSSYDNKNISKGSFTPDYKPLKVSPDVNITKLPTKVNNTNTFTNNKGLTPVTHNEPLASSFKFDEKNNDNKELLDEMKAQTKVQRDILVEIRKNSDDSKGLLEFVDDFKKKKKIPSPKGPKPSLLKRVSDGVSKAKNVLKNAGEKTLTKLGGLADKSKSIIKTTANIAKNAAAKGMTASTLATGAKVLSKAVPVAAAVGTGWEVGQAIGGAIYEKYQNTDFMKGVGATVAKVGAFFGNEEAKQAVAINEKYDENKFKDFGSLAAKFESQNNAGAISSGAGDHGGKSYGAFQLSSKTGDVNKFLKSSGYDKQFEGMAVGSKEFDNKWKELAKNDSNFSKAQSTHAAKEHYLPQLNKLKKEGIDLSSRGKGVQELIMSTGNQYGAGTSVILKSLKGKDVSKMSDKDIINAVQDYKAANVSSHFKSSSDNVKAGVAKRIESERALALKIDETDKKDSKNTQVSDKDSTKTTAKDNNVAAKDSTKTTAKDTKVASNTSTAKDSKVASNTPTAKDSKVASNTPTAKDSKVTSNTPTAKDSKVASNTPTAKDSKVTSNTPTAKDSKVASNTPTAKDSKVASNTPTAKDSKVAPNTSVSNDSKVAPNTSVSNDSTKSTTNDNNVAAKDSTKSTTNDIKLTATLDDIKKNAIDSITNTSVSNDSTKSTTNDNNVAAKDSTKSITKDIKLPSTLDDIKKNAIDSIIDKPVSAIIDSTKSTTNDIKLTATLDDIKKNAIDSITNTSVSNDSTKSTTNDNNVAAKDSTKSITKDIKLPSTLDDIKKNAIDSIIDKPVSAIIDSTKSITKDIKLPSTLDDIKKNAIDSIIDKPVSAIIDSTKSITKDIKLPSTLDDIKKNAIDSIIDKPVSAIIDSTKSITKDIKLPSTLDDIKKNAIDSIIDKPVSVINDSIKPNNKLENYHVKYTNALMPDNSINNTDSSNVSNKEMEKLSDNKIAINQGAMRASSTQGPAPTAQSSKQDTLTPNIEVRNQTSTIQRVFDRDANLII